MNPSVNVPANPKQRDRDVESKLRLYGIYNAFANGKLPSNNQIDVALTSFINHNKLRNPNDELSEEGRVILDDFRRVVEEAKRLILVKNHDQTLQEFIWNAQQLGQKGVSVGAPNAPVDPESANKDVDKGLEGLKTLGRLIITNGQEPDNFRRKAEKARGSQFRKLLNDAVVLLRSVASDAATKAASRVGPSQDQLDQLDDPAADHVWHETPRFSKNNFNLKSQFREKFDRNKPVDRNDVRDIAGNAAQAADSAGVRDPRLTAQRAGDSGDQRYGTYSGVDAVGGVRTGVEQLQQRLDENIPEEQQQRGREYRERSKKYFNEKMPKERREQTIWRLKKMIVEIQSHQDYKEAINTLLDLAETYSGHGRTVVAQGSQNAKGAHQDTHLQKAETSFKVLLERFANYTSADDLMDAINDIYRDADKDSELKNWFRSVDTYIRKCLQQEGYITQPQSSHEYDQLYDQGNYLFRNRYRDHTDRLMDEVRFLGDQFVQDPDNKRFGDALQKLFNDLGNDENGKPTFKKHLLKDITQVIIPDIFESIRYIPVPRIEYSDPMFDAVVENLVLEGDNLMPNVFEIGNESHLRFGRKTVTSSIKNAIMISASQIQCDLRDISYYVRRKKGFPAITDTGVMDVFLGGDGFGFNLGLSNAEKHDRARFFKVDDVKVEIKHLKIKLKKSQHKTMFGIFKPILLKVLKPVIVKALEQQIRKTFADLDAFAYRIYQEEQKIERQLKENPDPENAQNIYARYYQALQKELMSKKQAAEANVADKHVKMAVTTEDSMFSDIKLSGGISTKATEYREKARQGEGWENELFSIGSASPTTGIPQPGQVTRKSPHAHRRTVRDRDATSIGGYSRDSGYQGPEGAGALNGSANAADGYRTNPVTLNVGANPYSGVAAVPGDTMPTGAATRTYVN
ncbi:hypothetical protein FN846DRAFT_888338 [Sphaerosporella brunnea]|uniref:Uncharacterized protein n=1 Tax=Sphaerosporella brunnea TaxID=1250544 RepID=A0A5J5F314_9PEZI|nr:hypothetical protein FN846DRAFT_888338 [Sphaerosporella brunnea]